MMRIERMRMVAERASAEALQANLRRGDRKAKFDLSAVQHIAMTAALLALRDHIRDNAISNVGEITELLSPEPGVEMAVLRRALG